MSIYNNNEPLSSLTHLIGFLLAIAGLVLMIVSAVRYGSAWHIVAFSVFGASMVLLYLASAVYHFVPKASFLKKTFRKIDHSFIFVLIAGTYTPIALLPLRGPWGWTIFGLVWAIALFGIIAKSFELNLKHWQSVAMYLGMGWLIVIALPVIFRSLPEGSLLWLILGGMFYTVGVIFYSFDKMLPLHRWFGMHDVFHIFVMAGSFSHFWLMYKYVLYVG